MLLNNYARILLAKARRLIQSGEERFICVAIDDINKSGVQEHMIATELKCAIELAIEGRYAFECYLYEKYGIRPERIQGEDGWDKMDTSATEITYFPAEKFCNFACEARLAWIDRMLETHEVK